MSLTSPQQVHNKLGASPPAGKLCGNVCNGFWALHLQGSAVTQTVLGGITIHPLVANLL